MKKVKVTRCKHKTTKKNQNLQDVNVKQKSLNFARCNHRTLRKVKITRCKHKTEKSQNFKI